MKKKDFKTIKDYLETCSEDEKKFIYQIYLDMAIHELVDIIFAYPSADLQFVIEQVQEYRKEKGLEEFDMDNKEVVVRKVRKYS